MIKIVLNFTKKTIRRKCFYTGETFKTRYINILWSLKIHELFQTVQYCFCLNNTEICSERPLNYFTRSCIWVAKISTHHTTNLLTKMPQGKGTDTHLFTRPLQILHIRLVVVWFVAQRVKTECDRFVAQLLSRMSTQSTGADLCRLSLVKQGWATGLELLDPTV